MYRLLFLAVSAALVVAGCALTYDDDVNQDSLSRADSLRTAQDYCGENWLVEGTLDSARHYRGADSSWFVHWTRRDTKFPVHVVVQLFDTSSRGFTPVDLSTFPMRWNDSSFTVFDTALALKGDLFKVTVSEICSKTQVLELRIRQIAGPAL